MNVVAKKGFLLGAKWIHSGETVEVPDKRVQELLKAGTIVLAPPPPRAEPIETTTRSLEETEQAVRRGPGRPPKTSA
jgi:hypothetical protein